MKQNYVFVALVSMLALGACDDKSGLEKAQDKVNDALDRRPNEEIRDAVEEVTDAAKEVAEEARDAAKEAAGEAEDAAEEAGREAEEAVREATQ